MDEYLDYETNKKERERLLHMAFNEGYWDDQKELARKGVKHWEAASVLTAPGQARVIPRVIGKSLSRNQVNLHEAVAKQPVTLVTFAFSGLGDGHIKSYVEPFKEEFKGDENVKVMNVVIEENWSKAWAMNLFIPWMRFKTPVNERDAYIYYAGEFSALRRAAGMHNKLLGWVNLVDANGRIRWQAHGPASEAEKAFLVEGAKGLLEEKKAGMPKMLLKHVKKG
ncbi:ATPase assembly factor ATP10 [Chytridium lagenaria]|nr:ATPase assembly factor ATP10 [Chytridium lagenaria]